MHRPIGRYQPTGTTIDASTSTIGRLSSHWGDTLMVAFDWQVMATTTTKRVTGDRYGPMELAQ